MKYTWEKSPKKLNFTLVGKITFFFMCSRLGLNKDNENFTDFLSLDIGSQILSKNMLSIHVQTGNIFYDNYNTNKSIYTFLLNQQDEAKQLILPP